MEVECPKCKSSKIFKSTYFRRDYKTEGRITYCCTYPRYKCINCSHEFDTVKTGWEKVLDTSRARLM